MGASEIRAGKAFIEITEKGLAAVKSKFDALGKTCSKLGEGVSHVGGSIMKWSGAMLAPALAATKAYEAMGSEALHGAQRANISVESYSALAYIFERTGNSAEDLTGCMAKMTRNLGAAGQGNKEATAKFDALGISVSDLLKQSPDQQFISLADAISKIKNPTEQGKAATDAFSKSGQNLLPTLKQGAGGIQQLANRAKALGYILSGEDAEAAEDFGNRMKDCWQSLKMTAFWIGSALAPALQPLMEQFVQAGKVVADWIKENKGLILSVAKIAAMAFGAGAAIWALGTGIKLVGGFFSGIASAIGMVIPIITTLGSAILFVATSPLTLLIGGLVGLVAAVGFMVSSVNDDTTTLGGVWENMKTDFGNSWGSIIASLKSGNLSGAMAVAWALVKLEWARATDWLLEKWVAFKDGFQNVWIEASAIMQRIGVNCMSGLASAWIHTSVLFRQVWGTAINWFKQAWSAASRAVSQATLWVMYQTGQIDEATYNGAGKILDEEKAKEDRAREEQYGKDMATLENEKKERLSTIDQVNKEMLDGIEAERQKKQAARLANSKQQIADLKAGVDKAKDNLADATKAAMTENTKRNSVKAKEHKWGGIGGVDAFEGAKNKLSSAGTFNLAGVRALGSQKAEVYLAEIAKNTRNKDKVLVGA